MFPDIKHPYEEHFEQNKAEENRVLGELVNVFKTCPKHIAAVILEPILGEGGDKLASPEFYLSVQDIAHEHNALLIADEV